jgi:hypothetical protein
VGQGRVTRPFAFWIAVLAAVIVAVVLLREILLPFVDQAG